MKKILVSVSCLFISLMMHASLSHDSLSAIMHSSAYKKNNKQWCDSFNQFVKLQQAQQNGFNHVYNSACDSEYIHWCCQQRDSGLQALLCDLNFINLIGHGVILKESMLHTRQQQQSVQHVLPMRDSVSLGTTHEARSYADVVRHGRVRSFSDTSGTGVVSELSSISDVTSDKDGFFCARSFVLPSSNRQNNQHMFDTKEPQNNIKLEVVDNVVPSIVDAQRGIKKIQALLRGWFVRKNLWSIQQQLLYEQAERKKIQEQQVAPNIIALQVVPKIVPTKTNKKKSSIALCKMVQTFQSDEDLLQLQQADEQKQQDEFFKQHDKISGYIEKHANDIVTKMIPECKKMYPHFKKQRLQIIQYGIAPWSESWSKIFEQRQPDFTSQEVQFCKKLLEQKVEKKLMQRYNE